MIEWEDMFPYRGVLANASSKVAYTVQVTVVHRNYEHCVQHVEYNVRYTANIFKIVFIMKFFRYFEIRNVWILSLKTFSPNKNCPEAYLRGSNKTK